MPDATMRAYMALKVEHKRYKARVKRLLMDICLQYSYIWIGEYINKWIEAHPKEETSGTKTIC